MLKRTAQPPLSRPSQLSGADRQAHQSNENCAKVYSWQGETRPNPAWGVRERLPGGGGAGAGQGKGTQPGHLRQREQGGSQFPCFLYSILGKRKKHNLH